MARWQDDFAKSRIRGRAGRNVRRWVFPPARLRTRVCKKRHFKLHPTPSFRHLIAQLPLTPKKDKFYDSYLTAWMTFILPWCRHYSITFVSLLLSFSPFFLFLNSYFAITAVGYPILIWYTLYLISSNIYYSNVSF